MTPITTQPRSSSDLGLATRDPRGRKEPVDPLARDPQGRHSGLTSELARDAPWPSLAWWSGCFLLWLVICGGIALVQYSPVQSSPGVEYLGGDAPYYLMMALSMQQDGDLDLGNQLIGGLAAHDKKIALGVDGIWRPKHPVLFPVMAFPFTSAWGPPGALGFNVLCLAGLLLSTQALASRLAGRRAGIAAAALLLLGSYLPFAYQFSADVHWALLTTTMFLALFSRRALLAGLLAGLVVWAKILSFPFLVVAGIMVLRWRRPRLLAGFVLAGVLASAPMFYLNQKFFGSPLTTGYDRIATVGAADQPTLHSHRGDFSVPILEGLRGQVVDVQHGLIRHAPILFFALLGVWPWWRRDKWSAGLLMGASLVLLVTMSSYQYWMQGQPNGTRFLLPAIAIAAIPLGLTLRAIGLAVTALPAKWSGGKSA